jgi:hypothetical protein
MPGRRRLIRGPNADTVAALLCGRRARLDTDEEAAVADQRDSPLLEGGTVADRVPAGCGLDGEVGAERTHKLLVLGPRQPGDPPATVLGERDDVPPDRARGPATTYSRPRPLPWP